MDRLLTLRALDPLPVELRIKIFKIVLQLHREECKAWLKARSPEGQGDEYFAEDCNSVDDFLIRFVLGEMQKTQKIIEFGEVPALGVFIPSDRRWIEARCSLLRLSCTSTVFDLGCHLSI